MEMEIEPESVDETEASTFDTNWNDLPPKVKTQCIQRMEVGDKLQMRLTSKTEKLIVDLDGLGLAGDGLSQSVEDKELEVRDVEQKKDADEEDMYGYEEEEEQEPDFKVRTQQSILTEMRNKISEVNEILGVRPGICQALLEKYKWNAGFLLEKFYDKPDLNRFLSDVNVDRDGELHASSGDCEICCDDKALIGLSCDHFYCWDCFRNYLVEKILDGHSEIKCIGLECTLLFDEDKIALIIEDPAVLSCYERLIVEKYVQMDPFLKSCPDLNCGNAIQVLNPSIRHVACSCGYSFCFSCRNDSHEPVDCRRLENWLLKEDDDQSLRWVITNTKKCPKCVAPIEKNGGCNHMTCHNKNCRYEFCWLCMRDWRAHNNCNDYQVQATADRERSIANLERYKFYRDRYTGHSQSLKLEKTLRPKVDELVAVLKNGGLCSTADIQFIYKAIDTLMASRRTLMYSYVFAYYLEENYSAIIFKDNQKDLHDATERLSEVLENCVEFGFAAVDFKEEILHKYKYVEQRRQTLIVHCQEGEENDDWVFIP